MASSQENCLNCQQTYYHQSLLPLDYVDFTYAGQKITFIGCFVESQTKSTKTNGPKICTSCLNLLRTSHGTSKRAVMANENLQKPFHVCSTCCQLSPANNLMNIRLTVVKLEGRHINLEECVKFCVKNTLRSDANMMICLSCLSVIVEEYLQRAGTPGGLKPDVATTAELVQIKIEPESMLYEDVVDPNLKTTCKLEPEDSAEPGPAVFAEPFIERAKSVAKIEPLSPEPFEDDEKQTLRARYSRKKHRRRPTGGKKMRFSCAHCSGKFTYRSRLSEHMKIHRSDDHNREFECHHCPTKRFSRKSTVKEHLEMYHFPNNFRNAKSSRLQACPLCFQKFPTRSKFKSHLTTHRDAGELQCSCCKKVYTEISVFLRHVLNQKEVFRCSKCDQGFHSSSGLDKHMEMVHNESYVCGICKLPLFTRRTFETHQFVRHGIKTKVNCKHCNEEFESRIDLKDHMKQHQETPKKPWFCEQCGQAFRMENDLKIHQESHTLTEKLECYICHKRYKNSRTLANHVQIIHMRRKEKTSKTEYPCTVCPLRFERRQYLEGHMIVHNTENRPFFQCNRCGVAYTRRQKLQIHVNKCPKASSSQAFLLSV